MVPDGRASVTGAMTSLTGASKMISRLDPALLGYRMDRETVA
jgi:hypothetical protein